MLIVIDNDPTGPAALAAQKWLANNGPPDLKPLPLGYNEREALKHPAASATFSRGLLDRSTAGTTTLRRIRRSTFTPAA